MAAPAAFLVAGCGGRVAASGLNSATLVIHSQSARIDTNTTAHYTATLASGEPAKVQWSVSGGDPSSGAGTISAAGLYTPPHYLTRESVAVEIHARLEETSETSADAAELTVTPGFLQPLTPGNLSIGPGGTATITGSLTEVGGNGGIGFTLAGDPSGTPSLSGSLSKPQCTRGSVEGSNPSYTVCTVTYTAPALLPASSAVYVLGSVAGNRAISWTRILLNASGISSNPASHQSRLSVPVLLGSSSSNNADYDASLGQLADCCGGTLGSLVQDSAGTQYVLSNNHVLARSDQSLAGETIIQPGLIDNGCTPYGVGPGTTPVASLAGYPPLNSAATNVDAAIARVTSGAVDPKGNILELGIRQSDGTLAPAPPGISSTNGKGEAAALGMMVAKSGRTTGLTCAAVSAVSVDVSVDYFTDCAETHHAFTKNFTNQIAVAGAGFSDAGDSGALVVDAANAEPVGLFFAGGTDSTGIEQAIASPAPDVLAALDAQVPGPAGSATSYSFTGGSDHPVSCLNYGLSRPSGSRVEQTALAALSSAEREHADASLPAAQALLNTPGVARVSVAASSDSPTHSAIAVYLEPGVMIATAPSIPSSINGIPTVLVPAENSEVFPSQPRAASLNQALAVKRRVATSLLRSNPALFGIGVGQSLDNPADAALVLFADKHKFTDSLPITIEGQRIRLILMDRFHVTRSHATPAHSSNSCALRRKLDDADPSDLTFHLRDSLFPSDERPQK